MKSISQRIIFVAIIHVVIGALNYALFWLFSRDPGILSRSILSQIMGDPNIASSYLADVRGAFGGAVAASYGISIMLSAAFLVVCVMKPPAGDAQSVSKRGMWAGLLLSAGGATLGLCWLMVVSSPVASTLLPGLVLQYTALVVIMATAAFWFSTASQTPRASRPSVLGGGLFNTP